ncbi:hypothetical protein RHOSPDRAFT_27901 [Rhodotorula sp. JG-1b]|nr:hypothetical protein RHOSPDRAFT_27901 [Rhodotorula sp. JG-1b]
MSGRPPPGSKPTGISKKRRQKNFRPRCDKQVQIRQIAKILVALVGDSLQHPIDDYLADLGEALVQLWAAPIIRFVNKPSLQYDKTRTSLREKLDQLLNEIMEVRHERLEPLSTRLKEFARKLSSTLKEEFSFAKLSQNLGWNTQEWGEATKEAKTAERFAKLIIEAEAEDLKGVSLPSTDDPFRQTPLVSSSWRVVLTQLNDELLNKTPAAARISHMEQDKVQSTKKDDDLHLAERLATWRLNLTKELAVKSLMWQKEGRKLLSSSIQDYLTVARFPQLTDQNMQQIGYRVVTLQAEHYTQQVTWHPTTLSMQQQQAALQRRIEANKARREAAHSLPTSQRDPVTTYGTPVLPPHGHHHPLAPGFHHHPPDNNLSGKPTSALHWGAPHHEEAPPVFLHTAASARNLERGALPHAELMNQAREDIQDMHNVLGNLQYQLWLTVFIYPLGSAFSKDLHPTPEIVERKLDSVQSGLYSKLQDCYARFTSHLQEAARTGNLINEAAFWLGWMQSLRHLIIRVRQQATIPKDKISLEKWRTWCAANILLWNLASQKALDRAVAEITTAAPSPKESSAGKDRVNTPCPKARSTHLAVSRELLVALHKGFTGLIRRNGQQNALVCKQGVPVRLSPHHERNYGGTAIAMKGRLVLSSPS